ncbi:MAG: M3 family metallopeptidase [[Clostridium] fimetarium]|nr:M3 family metallopeptidase [Alistipes timonensis]MCM1405270.1 M3 family metallopeptidase [[Clostridium] fimetarium]
MKKVIPALTAAIALMTQTTPMQAASAPGAVFAKPFTETVHGTAPFANITNADYEPAIDRGIDLARKEIQAIATNPEAPTFENTIVALDRSGKDLDRVLNIFYNLLEADSDDEMMEISMRVTPKLSDYSTSIILNQDLWKRVKAVYDGRGALKLTPEQQTLLQKTYDSFALSGANLEGADREEYRKLSSELSELTTKFGQNVLKELNTYEIWLTSDDLAGLPEGVVAEAAQLAEQKGRKGEFLFTLAQPTYMAFMKYSERPDLRERFYRLYTGRNTKGEYSNMENIKRISKLRLKIANLLGAKTYAEHSLRRTMAQNPESVYKLLDQLRDAYRPALDKEMAELTEFASQAEGKPVTINAWDYSYWANKLKNARYAFDEEELRPYFELDNVINGVFGLATKLYGLQFTQNDSIQPYHPDVKAFDVTDDKGNFIGVIYTDFFPRASKRPGAWMTEFKGQSINEQGVDERPHVSIVMNFTKPTADKPSLLTPYEVETFLHEFGHALHGLLTRCTYGSLSGTSVYRDFVELPSQFNENYLTEQLFLDSFAKHYKTGEKIPANLVEKIVKSSQFGAAYACMRQLGFGYADMAWHTITAPVDDPAAFESAAIEQVRIFPDVEGSLHSPQFSHIFAGGYAAGYYSYKWAEVLDADAFAKFKENGIFDRATADSFRTNVLERGGTENPSVLYKRFRGQDPTIDALLIRDGILPAPAPKNLTPAKN